MLTEVIHARHLAELSFLETALSEAGLETNILEKSEEIPLNVLLASLDQDDKGRDRYINFSFVPLPEDGLEYIQLLQLYTSVPIESRSAKKGDLENFLLAVNCRLAIGHFSIKEDGELYYRYVHCTSSSQIINSEEFIEVVKMFVFMLNMFAGLIDEVASGKLELSAAMADFA